MPAFIKLTIASLALILALPAGSSAQQQDLRFEHLTADDGLSHNSVYAILQDRQGFMWFGTESGLSKYDGYTFTVYKHNLDDPNSLSHSWVEELYEDRRGTLWIGTDGGLNRFEPATDAFTRFVHDPNDLNSLSHNIIYAIHEDRQGTLWIGTKNGLNRFDRETDSFTRFTPNPDDLRSLTGQQVRAITEDRAGTLWIGTSDGGLNRFAAATESFGHYPQGPEASLNPNNNAVYALHTDRRGMLWIGTNDGLKRFDPATESAIHYNAQPNDPHSLSGRQIRVIEEDHEGSLWIGTDDGGLSRFDPDTDAFTRFLHDPGDPHSMSHNSIWSLYEDRFDMLWIGTTHAGISRVDLVAGHFVHVQHDRNNPNSLTHNSVWSIAADPTRPEVLWIGTSNGGLNRFDRLRTSDGSSGIFSAFQHDPNRPTSLANNFVEAVHVDRNEVLWAGTRGGLNRLNRDGRTFTRFLYDHPDITYRWIRVIYEAPTEPGVLWLAAGGGGLIRFDKETAAFRRFLPAPEGIGPNWISCIYEDRAGTLWVGAEEGGRGGLFRFDREAESFFSFHHDRHDPTSLISDEVTSIHEDPSGALWIGTKNGLSRFDRATETFSHFTTEDGLPHNTIYGILGDAEGHLWMSTSRGLSKFNRDTGTFHNYDVDRGTQGRAFNQFAYHQSTRGEMFFGGSHGFNAFFPDQIRDNPYPPQVAITRFRLFNQTPRAGETGPAQASFAVRDTITLSYKQNDLRFEYVGLHYGNSAKNQYAYKLEQYEDTWRYVGTQRTAPYTNLDPGEYIFRVKAANRDGVWSEDGAAVRVVITPPWWQTRWAYGLYVFLVVASIVAADRIQRTRLIRKEREQAQIREVELRAEAAELQTQAVEAQARALEAENERKEHELEKARELEKAYNQLRATQAQLIQAEKMASLGQLTAGIAHEIKNPLNFVNNFAEFNVEVADELLEQLRDHPDTPLATVKELLGNLKTSAQKINEQGKRADSIVMSMMLHAQGSTGKHETTDLHALLEKYINLAYHGLRANQTGFDVQIERDYQASVDTVKLVPQEMGRVFINLLNNAFYAVHRKAHSLDGAYVPTVSVRTRNLEDRIEIRLRDNGTGIPAKIVQQIFEPFFTTKPTGTGTGLGLSLSYDIVVQMHGGTFTVESEEGVFTEFTITLPLQEAE